jgi:uncharacterized protein (TIGR03067 family)
MLRIASAACLLVASVALAAEPEGDLKVLQGAWVIAEANLAARDHIDDFKGMKLAVEGENYTISFGKNSDKGTLKLDATKKPKQIDLTTTKEGPFKGRNLPGIYELKDDTVVLCLNSEKQDRPTAFEAKEKTPMMLLTFKREKK